MATAFQLYNENLLISLNYQGELTDLCWPVKGENNLLLRNKFSEAIYLNGQLVKPDYNVEPNFTTENKVEPSFILQTRAVSITLKVSLGTDKISKSYFFKNQTEQQQTLTIFVQVNPDFGSNHSRDTILFDPDLQGLICYEDATYLAVFANHTPSQYACQSPADFHGRGAGPDKYLQLTNNPVTIGEVTGCLKYEISLAAKQSVNFQLDYLLAANLAGLQRKLQSQTRPVRRLASNELEAVYGLVSKQSHELSKLLGLSVEQAKKLALLARMSLYIVTGAINTNGSMFAAIDSSYFKTGGVDDYSYLWPRDASLNLLALLNLDPQVYLQEQIRSGINYLASCFAEYPYLLHRYRLHRPNLGSSWHPWLDDNGKSRTPIQLDQTALLVHLYAAYVKKYQERIPELDSKLIAITKFLTSQIGKDGRISPCFDLWENHYGEFLSEQAALIAALKASKVLIGFAGNESSQPKLEQELAKNIEGLTTNINQTFTNDQGFLGRGYLHEKTEHQQIINQVDSSFHWLWQLGVLPAQTEAIKLTANIAERRLKLPSGGYARYENDHYLREATEVSGNPWYISTLWFANYYLQVNKLQLAKQTVEFVIDHMDQTGLLPEMADPNTGMALSVKPLVWSHAEVLNLLNWEKIII